MTARSPSAFFLSATLHGLVIAVAVFFSYLMQVQVKAPPKVMELVAGDGDNYGATAAPALGSSDTIKLKIPDVPAPKPAEPVAPPVAPVTPPAPEPVITKAPVQKAAPATTAPKEAKIPDFAKNVKRIEAKRRARIEARDRAAREAEEKRLAKAEAARAKVQHIDSAGIASGVIGGTTKEPGAGGKALTREEGDLLDAYYAIVKQRLRDGLDKPPGLSDAISAEAEFRLNADGSITNARISRSSGSDEFDRAVLDDLRHFHRVDPPKSWAGDTVNLTFRMKEED